jgi:hypothetical protein
MNKKIKTTLIHGGLFIATFITTTFAGAELCFGRSVQAPGFTWDDFKLGMEFSIPLLLFLTCHEFGHYFTAIYHKVKSSLPYYIPVPPIPMFNIGTLGAVIRLRSRPDRNVQIFDIGIAGPIAGFVMSLIILIYGFKTLPPAEHIFRSTNNTGSTMPIMFMSQNSIKKNSLKKKYPQRWTSSSGKTSRISSLNDMLPIRLASPMFMK